jgi:polyferredoxin/major membrane immunogen (membrane-anchored lipoprotein)
MMANIKTKKFKIPVIRTLRTLSQILFFILVPALFIGAFSGIKQICISIIHQNFSFTTLLPQMVVVFAIIPITLLVGRFFCGWMCAFGTMGDFIYRLSRKLFRRRFKISEKADRTLKYAKYILLAFPIVALWGLGSNTFATSNPWDAFGMLFTFGKTPAMMYVISNLLPAFILLIFIMIASFFVERFFCRYLCPLGAVFAIVSKPRITSILKPKAKCGKCRICTNSCPMGIALYKNDAVKSGECIHCFECVAACPRKNVSLAVSESDIRPVLAGAMAVTAMAGIYYVGSFSADVMAAHTVVSQSAARTTQSTPGAATANGGQTSSAAPTAKYADGTYRGSGTGYRGDTTTVSVTVKGGEITDIAVVSTGDDRQFFNSAFPAITRSIVSSQTADVNAVSGATYSSRGIMQAVKNALSKAS